LTQFEIAEDASNGLSVLRCVVAIDHRTTERVVVLSVPDRAQCESKLRLAAAPQRRVQTMANLAARDAVPLASVPVEIEPHRGLAIRYRVL
jgi:hypothetical protein